MVFVMSRYVLHRLPHRLNKVFVERLTEPLHLNFMSVFVGLLGSYRAKVAFDLVVRQQYAFPILHSAEQAKEMGISRLTLIEFGVGSGAGLLNMHRLAEKTMKATGVEFDIFGFDSGIGLPAAIDYRDLPETFQLGDFTMDREKLEAALPQNVKLIIGSIADNMPAFFKKLDAAAPVGFVSIDVDYYSSARDCLMVFDGEPDFYLPIVPVYLDDIAVFGSNPWTGEWLAVNEFNARNDLRKIAPFNMLRARRIFKNALWIDMMYACHIHDHPSRSSQARRRGAWILKNEYIE